MNRFKSGIKIRIACLCLPAMCIFMCFLADEPNAKIVFFIFFILTILVVIGAFKEEYVVEDDRLVYKCIFKTIIVYWKDIRVISLSYDQKETRPCIWVQKAEDVMNCKVGKTMTISYHTKDYKVLVRMIVEKCKDNKQAYVEQSVLKLISQSSDK